MSKKRPTAMVAKKFVACLLVVAFSGSSVAQIVTPNLDAYGNDLISDPALMAVSPGAACGDGAELRSAAYLAANRLIESVNAPINRIGSEMRTKRTCLENINALISVSMPSFPSLSGVIGKIAAGIINSMINKACGAVVGSINSVVNKVNKEVQDAKNGVMNPINEAKQSVGELAGGGTQYVQPGELIAPAPTPVQTAAPAPSGWQSLTCKIFGGC